VLENIGHPPRPQRLQVDEGAHLGRPLAVLHERAGALGGVGVGVGGWVIEGGGWGWVIEGGGWGWVIEGGGWGIGGEGLAGLCGKVGCGA